jgi:hypothetical protein
MYQKLHKLAEDLYGDLTHSYYDWNYDQNYGWIVGCSFPHDKTNQSRKVKYIL